MNNTTFQPANSKSAIKWAFVTYDKLVKTDPPKIEVEKTPEYARFVTPITTKFRDSKIGGFLMKYYDKFMKWGISIYHERKRDKSHDGLIVHGRNESNKFDTWDEANDAGKAQPLPYYLISV